MSWQIIGNPIAGGGRGKEAIGALEQALGAEGVECAVYLTRGAGDARRRAAELDGGTRGVAVVGGDGTLNEVLNGLTDPGAFPLTQLPMGTANLLARELGLPWDPAGAARMIAAGKVRRVDMGVLTEVAGRGALGGEEANQKLETRAKSGIRNQKSGISGQEAGPAGGSRNAGVAPHPPAAPAPTPRGGEGRRFLLVASAGFDAMVIEDIQSRRKGKLGAQGYLMPVLRTLWRYRRPRLRVSVDGGTAVEGALVVASSIRCYAGVFCVTDRAACDSGHLDVCVLRRGSVPALASYALSARRGGLSGRRDVAYLTGRRVRIEAEQPTAVEVDGEYVGTTPVEMELEAGVVPVVVP